MNILQRFKSLQLTFPTIISEMSSQSEALPVLETSHSVHPF